MRENTYIHPLLTFPKEAFQRQYQFVKNIVFMLSSGEKKITNTNTNTIQIFNYKYSSNSFKIELSWKLISEQLFILYMLHPLSSKGL